MITFTINKQTFYLPENWQELVNSGHYATTAAILYNGRPEPEQRSELLMRLSGFSGYAAGKAMKGRVVTDTFAMQIKEELFPVLDFIFSGENLMDQNPLPFLWVRGKPYVGIKGRMEQQRGWEMEEAGWAATEYFVTRNPARLSQLVATLYKPLLMWGNGEAVPFQNVGVQRRTKVFAALPMAVKLGVLLYYTQCEEWWHRTYAQLYDSSGSGKGSDSLSTSKLIRGLAGGKRGTIADVRQMTRDEIFFELAQLHAEALKD